TRRVMPSPGARLPMKCHVSVLPGLQVLIWLTPQRPEPDASESLNESMDIGSTVSSMSGPMTAPPVLVMVTLTSTVSPGRTGSGLTSTARLSGGSVAVGVLLGVVVAVVVGVAL